MVSELELDELDLAGDLEVVFAERCFFGYLCGNGVLLRYCGATGRSAA